MDLLVKIFYQEAEAIKEKCHSVSLPGTSGIVEILPGHENFIVQLKNGNIIIKGASEKKINITSGFAQIKNNECTISLV